MSRRTETTSRNRATQNTTQLIVYALVCAAILLLPLLVQDDFMLNRIARYLALGDRVTVVVQGKAYAVEP